MIEKLGSRWFVVALVVALAAWASVKNWPINLGIDLSGGVTLSYSVDPKSLKEVVTSGESQADAIGQMIEVISTRIDSIGIRDLSVRREGNDRILIQAPHLSSGESAEIRHRMTQLGKLEFLIGLGVELGDRADKQDLTVPGRTPGVKETYSFTTEAADAQRKAAIEEGKTKTAAAVAAGTPNPSDVYRDGTVYELKATDGRGLGIFWKPLYPSVTVGKKNGAVTEKEARLALQDAKDGKDYKPDHIMGGWLYSDPDFYGHGNPGFTGKDIDKVNKSRDEMGKRTVVYEVALGRRSEFFNYTSRYVKRPMCLVLNDEVWSYPTIDEALRDSVQIRGGGTGFTEEAQNELVNCLQSGSLKLRPKLEGEDTIAPTLGDAAINLGLTSSLVAAALVFIFALIYYRFSGLVAVLTLILNILLTLAVMLLFKATLNLPGIAGLALTIGMAIDANILIYERIREEMERGRSFLAAVDAGFSRALAPIVDGHLTTLITSILLYKYGVGPIKGFAWSLTAGLIVSLFTSCFVARTIMMTAIRLEWVKGINYMRLFPATLNFRFLDKAKVMMSLSAVMILVSVVAFFASDDRKYGLDFTGGYIVRMNVDKALSTNEVSERIYGIKNDENKTKYTQVAATGLSNTAAGNKTFKSHEVKIQSLKGVTPTAITARISDDLKAIFKEELKPVSKASRDESSPGDWKIEFSFHNERSRNEVTQELSNFKDLHGQEPYQGIILEFVDGVRVDPILGDTFATGWRLAVNEKTLLGHEVMDDLNRVFAPELPKMPGGAMVDQTKAYPKLSYVGPNVVHNLKTSTIVAVVLAILANIVYIWFRFKQVKFGLSAVIAVFHDAIISIGAIVIGHRIGLINVPIDLPIIAGVLTVMGYSTNDTIVVFDRMRENLGNIKGTYKEVLNHSLNQTLDRTILTSVTVFLTVLILFIFNYGQESGIEGIAFTMLVGVMVGTYSSIYIATPILVWLHNREEAKKGNGPGGAAPHVAKPKPAPASLL